MYFNKLKDGKLSLIRFEVENIPSIVLFLLKLLIIQENINDSIYFDPRLTIDIDWNLLKFEIWIQYELRNLNEYTHTPPLLEDVKNADI